MVNLRPLTLLCVDFKVIEKVLANTLKRILDQLINMDQKGFMAGRNITCNIRRVMDLIEIAEQLDIDGIILSMDYLKCFDRVEIRSLFGAMRFFNIGPYFIKMVKSCYAKTSAVIINNGNISPEFNTTRGLRQGAPASPYYFLLCAEVLSMLLHREKNIKGFSINDFNRILGQFADDMDIILAFR